MVEEARYLSDRVDRGIAELREQQAVGRTEGYKLTEIDGIGPATAETLEQAGITKASDLARVTPRQLEMIDGIGPATAERLASQFQYRASRTTGHAISESDMGGVPDDDLEEAREANAERSPEARAADRSFNARMTLDVDEWKANKGRLDYPGVDSVPEQRRAERVREKAKTARDRGALAEIDPGKIQGNASGRNSGGHVQVDVGSSWDPVSTLAHELGHAVSTEEGRGEAARSSGFFEDEQVREEAEELAVRRRTMLSEGSDLEKYYDEQDVDEELFADAFAVAVEEPRAAKREAPNLFRKLQDETIREYGRF